MRKEIPLEIKMQEMRKVLGIRDDERWQTPGSYADKSKRLSTRVGAVLKRACPELSDETVSAFAVDAADFWAVGKYHEHYLKQFLSLQFPRDAKRLESLLAVWIEVQVLVHGQWHMRSLKRTLPKILQELTRTTKTENYRKRKKR